MRAAPTPGSPEWAAVVTASKVAAILGLSPHDSRRSIWHVLRGEVPADDGTNAAAKSRGHYLEGGVLDWWCDQHPELIHGERQRYFTRPELPWAAATPDLISRDDAGSLTVTDAKTARDDDEWGAPGTDEMPARHAAQLTWQMQLSGARRGYIALLTTRLDLREYVLDYDATTAAAMERIAHQFWESTQDDAAAPLVDDSVATLTTLRRLHPDIDRDLTVDLDEDVAHEYVEAITAEKAAEARARKAKSTLLEAMGRARLAKHGALTIARRQPNAHGISLVAVAKTLPERTEAA